MKNRKDRLVIFQNKKIRRTWYQSEWFFSVVDVVEVLTENKRSRKYWNDLKKKLLLEGSQVCDKIVQLKFLVNDGKL